MKHDMQELWRRIDAWLTEQDEYAVENSLAEGASAEQIAGLEAELGVTLPEEVRASLAIHDGSHQTILPEARWSLLGVDDIRRTWGWMKKAFDAGEHAPLDESVRPGPGVLQSWWRPTWIPIASDMGGDYLALDLEPGEGGRRGQLVRLWRDIERREAVAPGFGEWMSHFVDELESGKYAYDDGVGLEEV